MKKILLILSGCLAYTAGIWAQATPKWVEKAQKAVFSIVTYDNENKIKSTGNGFYVQAGGTALSDYTLFEGAQRAVVINADGKELPVERIMGANSMYDIVKFTTPADKKTVSLQVAARPATVGETVYLLPYSTQKTTACQTAKITQVDTIGDKCYYYTLAMKATEKIVSCPVMNTAGEVLGLIQKNASEDSNESYVLGAGYGAGLAISPLSANDRSLNGIGIPKGLPDTEEQAQVYLFMAASQQDPEQYLETLNYYLQVYPNSPEGYTRRASYYMGLDDDSHNALAATDLSRALEVSSDKPETEYNVAKIIYTYILGLEGQPGNAEWGYERALDLVREALKADPQPTYVQLEGDILFAMGNYADAYASYEKVNQSELASPATFYAAAKAKQLEGGDPAVAIALMDSAIVRFNPPYTSEAAPYFYERAEMKAQQSKFREAVMDYDLFYEAIGGRVTAEFYFQREQSEIQCRMYQQAINDINKATELLPQDADLWVEKGTVHLRVGQYAEAVEALNKAISLSPELAAAYRMLGYCQVMQKNSKQACENFAKAKELGDTVVDSLIEKYCK